MVKHHSHDVVNAGKTWVVALLCQNGQEDVRKDPFHGQFDSIWLSYPSTMPIKIMECLFLVWGRVKE